MSFKMKEDNDKKVRKLMILHSLQIIRRMVKTNKSGLSEESKLRTSLTSIEMSLCEILFVEMWKL